MGNEDQFFPFEEVQCPFVRDVTDYWFSLGKDGGLPLAADFDPVMFPEHAPWMVFSDVLDDGADFMLRMVGTKAVRVLGVDITGKRLSEGGKDYVEGRLSRIFARVISAAGPIWGRGRVGADEGRTGYDSEACILPLVNEAGALVRLIHMVRLRTDDGEWLT